MSNKLTHKRKWSPQRVFSDLAAGAFSYTDLDIPDEVAAQLESYISFATQSVSSIELLNCEGKNCPFKVGCLLYKNDSAPVGKPCYYEARLFQGWMEELITNGDIDVSDTATMSLVSDITEMKILRRRILMTMTLGYGDSKKFTSLLCESKTTGPYQEVLATYEQHPLLDSYLKIDQRIEKKLKELMGTPIERHKKKMRERDLDKAVELTASRAMSDLVKAITSGQAKSFIDFTPDKSMIQSVDVIDAEYEDNYDDEQHEE